MATFIVERRHRPDLHGFSLCASLRASHVLDAFRSVRFCSFTPKLLRTDSEVCLTETPTDGRQRPRIGLISTIRYLPGNDRRSVGFAVADSVSDAALRRVAADRGHGWLPGCLGAIIRRKAPTSNRRGNHHLYPLMRRCVSRSMRRWRRLYVPFVISLCVASPNEFTNGFLYVSTGRLRFCSIRRSRMRFCAS